MLYLAVQMKTLHKDAVVAADAMKWLGALGAGAPLHHFERCSVLTRNLADKIVASLGPCRIASGHETDMVHAGQLAVQAQYTLTLSRIVDVDHRVGEIAACEALLGEVCDIIGRVSRRGEAAHDGLAQAGV